MMEGLSGAQTERRTVMIDANRRPISLFMTAGQVSDYTGAAALLASLPGAQWLLVYRGYKADWFRDALQAKVITPCIPGRKSRAEPTCYDKRRSKRRNRLEIIFGRRKDWRRVATRYDRCPAVFLSAVALAATVLFGLGVLSLGVETVPGRPYARKERRVPGGQSHRRRAHGFSERFNEIRRKCPPTAPLEQNFSEYGTNASRKIGTIY